MRTAVFFLVCWAVTGPAPAMEPATTDTIPPATRLLSHHAAVTLDPDHRFLACIDTLTLRHDGEDAGTLTLHLYPAFSVEKTVLNGENVSFVFRQGVLGVPAPERATGDSLVELIVSYSGTIDFPSGFSRITTGRAVLREEEVLPFAGRDLRSGRLQVTVPESWSAVTAGAFGGVVDSGGTRTFTYFWDEPIPSIGWICAGRYKATTERPAGTTITVYTDPGDSSDLNPLATLSDSALSFYGASFSPYPYERLSILEIEDWVGGNGILAIAAPGFIMVKHTAFVTDDPYNRVETILPHEIAHQWWPGSVFIDAADAPFLMEGLCEYSSRLFNEARGELGGRDTLPNSPLLRPLLTRVREGKDAPLSGAQDLRWNPTQYLKSAYVHHMLRGEIGDSAYRSLLKRFVRRFHHATVTLTDFEELTREVSGREMRWFFDQWVTRTGVPSLKIYNVRRERRPSGWRVTGRLRIVGYDRYTVSAVIELRTVGDTLRRRVKVGALAANTYRNDVPFEFLTGHAPLSVVLDPDGALLLMRKMAARLGDLRDPSTGILIVGTLSDGAFLRSLAERDSAVLEKIGWSVGIRQDTGITLGDLQGYHIILYGDAAQNSQASNLSGAFPITTGGDSALIAGETIRDSTLTLIQVVENPYLADALLCWIVPLGEGIRYELRPYDRSWILLKGKEEIVSGTWEVSDDNLEVNFGEE